MSDPVTNVEIEDVLSSIRRLVSDDVRVVKPKPEAVNQPDRLVLTPALRVSEEGPDIRESSKGPVVLRDMSTDGDIAPAEKDVEKLLEFPVDVSLEETAELSDAGDDPASGLQDDMQTEDAGIADAFLGDLVEEEVERALSEVEIDIEAELVEDVIDREELVLQSLVADLAEAAGVSDLDDLATELPDADNTLSDLELPEDAIAVCAGDDPALAGESLEEKIAALEEMVGRGQTVEPETEEPASEAPVFQRSSDVMDWQDHVPEDMAVEQADFEEVNLASDPISDDVPPKVESPQIDPSQGSNVAQDTATIDEGVLRDLVSDIVRQELQGALGERITRNVRKLVRREIHRVLMSQEFD